MHTVRIRMRIRIRMYACAYAYVGTHAHTHTYVRVECVHVYVKMLSVVRYSHRKIKLQDEKTTCRDCIFYGVAVDMI